MKRLLLLNVVLAITVMSFSQAIVVKNMEELNNANKQARPGTIIILQNGEWNNVTMALNCTGTKEQPVTFKAQTPGKVAITGNSKLKLGGSFIVVDGLNFRNGYAGDDAVIEFRIDKNQLANNCRVTNCVINDFNNPKRMDENNWILFYGKSNQLDHCSFLNKKNMGVLLAVVLDDDRSRENFHSINHNYFGVRIPLASNGGEIIRVGVSQHCQFNSNTQITDNFFEHCDGEAEVISIKSGRNIVRGNLFKECQGSVVLRHGDNNTVENNIFLGNDKEGTGGVRVINKGQWIVNNFFYKCRGTDFRSPLAIMNGIPNSPAHRYVQVTDAVIANNSFYNCSPFSLCEGSDTERTLPPQKAYVLNNIVYNTKDPVIYHAYDNIGGMTFAGNEINKEVTQSLAPGFTRTVITFQKNDNKPFPVTTIMDRAAIPDSLLREAKNRLAGKLFNKAGFQDLALAKKIQANAYACGAKWFEKNNHGIAITPLRVNCKNADEVYSQLSRTVPLIITLTGKQYLLNKPFVINRPVEIIGSKVNVVNIATQSILAAFIISGNGRLSFRNLNINGSGVKATSFVSSDSTGPSDHYNLAISDCNISSFDRRSGCQNLFNAYKSMVADSIIVRKCSFSNNKTDGFILNGETENRGYYNVEKISFADNEFNALNGIILSLYRGGSDESTLGPKPLFTKNNVKECNTVDTATSLIQLTGVQQSNISSNSFVNCNPTGKLIYYADNVRANHILQNNSISSSGAIHVNKFVTDRGNTFRTTYKKYY